MAIALTPVVIAPKDVRAAAEATPEQVSQLIALVAKSGIIQLPPDKTWDQALALSFSFQKATQTKPAHWKIGSIFNRSEE